MDSQEINSSLDTTSERLASAAGNATDQAQPAQASLWMIRTRDEQELGPADVATIAQWMREGKVGRDCEARLGEGEWQPLEDSPLAKEFAIKTLFNPVKAHADIGAGIGALIGAVGWLLLALITASSQVGLSVLQVVLLLVVMLLALPSISKALQSGCIVQVLTIGFWTIVVGVVTQGKLYSFGVLAGAFLALAVGGLLGMIPGYLIGALVGLLRRNRYRLPVH